MNETSEVDAFWEKRYSEGHQQHYPWDVVVSFVFRYAPKNTDHRQIRLLEIGCGTASNLWFAAREGFSVAGLDASQSAIQSARRRFDEEGLSGDLQVGDFTKGLPWKSNSFDFVIDRAAVTYADDYGLVKVLGELNRVLKPGGHGLFNLYADTHSSYRTGRMLENGLVVDITGGSLANSAATRFCSRSDVNRYFDRDGWKLCSVARLELVDMLEEKGAIHAEYRIIIEKMR